MEVNYTNMCTIFINKNDVKPIAIYVHGLGSGAASTTVRMVCEIFSEYDQNTNGWQLK